MHSFQNPQDDKKIKTIADIRLLKRFDLCARDKNSEFEPPTASNDFPPIRLTQNPLNQRAFNDNDSVSPLLEQRGVSHG